MNIRASARIEAMSAFALADLGGHDVPTLAQNESAFPPSPHAIAAGQEAAARSPLYPDPDWTVLRNTLAAAYNVDRDLILCGNGSMDLIACTIRAFAHEGGEVLATSYAYNFAAAATAQAGAIFVKAAETDFVVSIDNMLAAVTPATRVAFLCNPGNPTGTRIANSEILRLRAALRPDILLIVDQAYGEFDEQDPRSIFDLVGEGNTVVLRTLSKAYGLAGARIGWGLFPPPVAAQVRKLQNSNNVTVVSLAMAVAALEDRDYMRLTVTRTAAIRDRFADRLRAAGYNVVPSSTNFVLIRFGDVEAVRLAEQALRQEGIIMRNVGGYGLADCLRATIGPESVMENALRILAALPGRR
jgi:histidinol-phosphate aminotransferase